MDAVTDASSLRLEYRYDTMTTSLLTVCLVPECITSDALIVCDRCCGITIKRNVAIILTSVQCIYTLPTIAGYIVPDSCIIVFRF